MAKKIVKSTTTSSKLEVNRDSLMGVVLDEINNNVNAGDLTAIDELIKAIPTEKLLAFLPEEFTKHIKVIESPTQVDELPCLNVTHVQVYPLAEMVGKTRARARIVLNEQFQLTGLRIVEGSNGLYVSYPSDPSYKGEDCRPLFYPLTKALRENIEAAILIKYNEMNND